MKNIKLQLDDKTFYSWKEKKAVESAKLKANLTWEQWLILVIHDKKSKEVKK